MIVGDVVDFERTSIFIAQYQIGFTCSVNRADARELPIQANRADEGGAGELVVSDVVQFQPAGIDVAQQQIGFPGDAAEITDAGNCQFKPTLPMKAAPVSWLLAMS